jgi:predicted nucleic acid-binding Zn ribbon protein
MSDDPVPISEVLSAVVRDLRPASRPASGDGRVASRVDAATVGGVFGRWTDVVGPAVAEHVQPVKLDGTLLIVEVDDPAWATQLTFLEQTLRRRLAEEVGADVERIEVRVRGRRLQR